MTLILHLDILSDRACENGRCRSVGIIRVLYVCYTCYVRVKYCMSVIYVLCVLYLCSMCVICVLYVCYMYVKCVLYVCNVRVICAIHIHTLLSLSYSLSVSLCLTHCHFLL